MQDGKILLDETEQKENQREKRGMKNTFASSTYTIPPVSKEISLPSFL